MNTMSYKTKIYMAIVLVVLLCLIFFFFIYGRMNASNQALAESVAAKRQDHEDVLAEQKSYEQGKQDLAALAKKKLQPADLFSQDTKVVKEIKTLEAISHNLGLKFTLQVTGTSKNAIVLPKSTAKIATIPYNMVLEGPFDKTLNFVEATQHLPFITQIDKISMSGSATGTVFTTLSAEFYIKP